MRGKIGRSIETKLSSNWRRIARKRGYASWAVFGAVGVGITGRDEWHDIIAIVIIVAVTSATITQTR